MTTPLIQEEESNLPWQQAVKQNQQNLATQVLTDNVKAPVDELGYDSYYRQINNIRQSSQIATQGQIAADNKRREIAAAQAAAAREAARQKALEDAARRGRVIASGGSFGQPDWTTYPQSGYAPGTGPSSTFDRSDESIADLMRAVGFSEADIGMGLAIVQAESSNNALANHENPDQWGSLDQGLWQINNHWQADKIAGKDVYDPYVNTLIAKQIFDESGWGAWTTFNNGLTPKAVPAPRQVMVQSFPANTGSTGLRNTILDKASVYFGFPYVWGGESTAEGGFDCSGLVYRAYADAGIDISRTTANDYSLGGGGINGQRTTLDQLRPGDLVAWDHNRSGEADSFVGHIAIYAGNGEIIESRGDGTPVRRTAISQYDHLIGIKVNLPGD